MKLFVNRFWSILLSIICGNLVLYDCKFIKWLSFGKVKTIMLFGITMTSKPGFTVQETMHEAIHRRQWYELFTIAFLIIVLPMVIWHLYWLLLVPYFLWYFLYAFEWLTSYYIYQFNYWKHMRGKLTDECYYSSALNLEAFDKQTNTKYLLQRVPFSFLAYYKAITKVGIKWKKRGFFIKTFC